MTNDNFYKGIPVIGNKTMTMKSSDIPKRKNKSKRIQKKWLKKYGYKDIPSDKMFFFDGKLIGHPSTIKKVFKLIQKGAKMNMGGAIFDE